MTPSSTPPLLSPRPRTWSATRRALDPTGATAEDSPPQVVERMLHQAAVGGGSSDTAGGWSPDEDIYLESDGSQRIHASWTAEEGPSQDDRPLGRPSDSTFLSLPSLNIAPITPPDEPSTWITPSRSPATSSSGLSSFGHHVYSPLSAPWSRPSSPTSPHSLAAQELLRTLADMSSDPSQIDTSPITGDIISGGLRRRRISLSTLEERSDENNSGGGDVSSPRRRPLSEGDPSSFRDEYNIPHGGPEVHGQPSSATPIPASGLESSNASVASLREPSPPLPPQAIPLPRFRPSTEFIPASTSPVPSYPPLPPPPPKSPPWSAPLMPPRSKSLFLPTTAASASRAAAAEPSASSPSRLRNPPPPSFFAHARSHTTISPASKSASDLINFFETQRSHGRTSPGLSGATPRGSYIVPSPRTPRAEPLPPPSPSLGRRNILSAAKIGAAAVTSPFRSSIAGRSPEDSSSSPPAADLTPQALDPMPPPSVPPSSFPFPRPASASRKSPLQTVAAILFRSESGDRQRLSSSSASSGKGSGSSSKLNLTQGLGGLSILRRARERRRLSQNRSLMEPLDLQTPPPAVDGADGGILWARGPEREMADRTQEHQSVARMDGYKFVASPVAKPDIKAADSVTRPEAPVMEPPVELVREETEDNLRQGHLWYLNVHDASLTESSLPRWIRCDARLGPTALHLSWPTPAGRAAARLDLVHSEEVRSTPSPMHPQASEDVGTLSARVDPLLAESLHPFQICYPDGIERLATDSALERTRWVAALWDVIAVFPADQGHEQSASEPVPSPKFSQRTLVRSESGSSHTSYRLAPQRTSSHHFRSAVSTTVPPLMPLDARSSDDMEVLYREDGLLAPEVTRSSSRKMAGGRGANLRRTASTSDLAEAVVAASSNDSTTVDPVSRELADTMATRSAQHLETPDIFQSAFSRLMAADSEGLTHTLPDYQAIPTNGRQSPIRGGVAKPSSKSRSARRRSSSFGSIPPEQVSPIRRSLSLVSEISYDSSVERDLDRRSSVGSSGSNSPSSRQSAAPPAGRRPTNGPARSDGTMRSTERRRSQTLTSLRTTSVGSLRSVFDGEDLVSSSQGASLPTPRGHSIFSSNPPSVSSRGGEGRGEGGEGGDGGGGGGGGGSSSSSSSSGGIIGSSGHFQTASEGSNDSFTTAPAPSVYRTAPPASSYKTAPSTTARSYLTPAGSYSQRSSYLTAAQPPSSAPPSYLGELPRRPPFSSTWSASSLLSTVQESAQSTRSLSTSSRHSTRSRSLPSAPPSTLSSLQPAQVAGGIVHEDINRLLRYLHSQDQQRIGRDALQASQLERIEQSVLTFNDHLEDGVPLAVPPKSPSIPSSSTSSSSRSSTSSSSTVKPVGAAGQDLSRVLDLLARIAENENDLRDEQRDIRDLLAQETRQRQAERDQRAAENETRRVTLNRLDDLMRRVLWILGDDVYHGSDGAPSEEESLYGPEVRSVHPPASIRELSEADLEMWDDGSSTYSSKAAWDSDHELPPTPTGSLDSGFRQSQPGGRPSLFRHSTFDTLRSGPSFSSLPPTRPPSEVRSFDSELHYRDLPRRPASASSDETLRAGSVGGRSRGSDEQIFYEAGDEELRRRENDFERHRREDEEDRAQWETDRLAAERELDQRDLELYNRETEERAREEQELQDQIARYHERTRQRMYPADEAQRRARPPTPEDIDLPTPRLERNLRRLPDIDESPLSPNYGRRPPRGEPLDAGYPYLRSGEYVVPGMREPMTRTYLRRGPGGLPLPPSFLRPSYRGHNYGPGGVGLSGRFGNFFGRGPTAPVSGMYGPASYGTANGIYPSNRTGSPYAEPHVYGNIGRRRSDTSSDETRSRSDLSNSLSRAERDQRNRVASQPSQVPDHLHNDRRAHEEDLNKISNSIHQLRDDLLLPASQLNNHPPSQVPTIVLDSPSSNGHDRRGSEHILEDAARRVEFATNSLAPDGHRRNHSNVTFDDVERIVNASQNRAPTQPPVSINFDAPQATLPPNQASTSVPIVGTVPSVVVVDSDGNKGRPGTTTIVHDGASGGERREEGLLSKLGVLPGPERREENFRRESERRREEDLRREAEARREDTRRIDESNKRLADSLRLGGGRSSPREESGGTIKSAVGGLLGGAAAGLGMNLFDHESKDAGKAERKAEKAADKAEAALERFEHLEDRAARSASVHPVAPSAGALPTAAGPRGSFAPVVVQSDAAPVRPISATTSTVGRPATPHPPTVVTEETYEETSSAPVVESGVSFRPAGPRMTPVVSSAKPIPLTALGNIASSPSGPDVAGSPSTSSGDPFSAFKPVKESWATNVPANRPIKPAKESVNVKPVGVVAEDGPSVQANELGPGGRSRPVTTVPAPLAEAAPVAIYETVPDTTAKERPLPSRPISSFLNRKPAPVNFSDSAGGVTVAEAEGVAGPSKTPVQVDEKLKGSAAAQRAPVASTSYSNEAALPRAVAAPAAPADSKGNPKISESFKIVGPRPLPVASSTPVISRTGDGQEPTLVLSDGAGGSTVIPLAGSGRYPDFASSSNAKGKQPVRASSKTQIEEEVENLGPSPSPGPQLSLSDGVGHSTTVPLSSSMPEEHNLRPPAAAKASSSKIVRPPLGPGGRPRPTTTIPAPLAPSAAAVKEKEKEKDRERKQEKTNVLSDDPGSTGEASSAAAIASDVGAKPNEAPSLAITDGSGKTTKIPLGLAPPKPVPAPALAPAVSIAADPKEGASAKPAAAMAPPAAAKAGEVAAVTTASNLKPAVAINDSSKATNELLQTLQKAIADLKEANEKRQKDEEAHRKIQAEQAKKIDQLFAANEADKAAMAKRMHEEEKKPPPTIQTLVDVSAKNQTDNTKALKDLNDELAKQNAANAKALEETKKMAKEQVAFNLTGHLNDFSKNLAGEVKILMKEVGDLREAKRALQHEIADLLLIKARHGGGDGLNLFPMPGAAAKTTAAATTKKPVPARPAPAAPPPAPVAPPAPGPTAYQWPAGYPLTQYPHPYPATPVAAPPPQPPGPGFAPVWTYAAPLQPAK